MEIRFQRQALYEEVWQHPLTTLARKYGLSDNGIRKVCKALTIPLPGLGHWAKVAAGHDIPRPPLPPAGDRTEFVSTPQGTPPRSLERDADEAWLAERAAFEALPENRIVVDLEPRRWHKLILPTRDRFREKVKEIEADLKAASKPEKKHVYWSQPRFDGPNPYRWKYFNERGQLLEVHRCLPLRVTLKTWQRALAIVNTLLFEAEQRGIAVAHDEKDGRLTLTIRNAGVQLRMSEKLLEIPKDRKGMSELERRLGRDTIKAPTGILRINVSANTSEHAIQETDHEPLETRLNEVFRRVYRGALRELEAQRKRDAWNREWEAEEERRRRAEATRQEEARRRRQEEERRKNLLQEAKAWQDAKLIREYADHVEELSSDTSDRQVEPLSEWLGWVRHVADDLDPSADRIRPEPNTQHKS